MKYNGILIMDTYIEKLRRFSLTFGLFLLTYSIAGVKLTTPINISPFGISFTIERPELLGYGLVIGTVYGAIRYFYYALLISLPPAEARKKLLSGKLINGFCIYDDGTPLERNIAKFLNDATNEVEKYFPVLPWKEKIQANVNRKNPYIFHKFEIPSSTKILVRLQDLDYYLPIWFNIISLLIFMFK